MQMTIISSTEFCTVLGRGGATVLDVRTEIEHKGAHLACGHDHTPLDRLDVDAWMKRNSVAAGSTVYVLCASGKRAAKAAELLARRSVNALVVDGGLSACVASGIQTEGKKVVSLERQVRMAAGSMVLAGVLLGAFVAPVFYALSGFAGAGLIFAGVTDWCGMGLLLARAPWNRDEKTAIQCSLKKFEQKTKGA